MAIKFKLHVYHLVRCNDLSVVDIFNELDNSKARHTTKKAY